MTRVDSTTGDYYATSGHMIWVGDRTRQLGRRACRILPRRAQSDRPQMRPLAEARRADPADRRARPRQEPGRLTLICRFGADKVEDRLPPLIRAVEARGAQGAVVVRSDARQHDQGGDRLQDAARSSASSAKSAASSPSIRREGTHAGGVHLEMTGKNVTECTGGARAISEADLHDRYHTYCDPRLNAEQAIEVAFLVAELLEGRTTVGAGQARRRGRVEALPEARRRSLRRAARRSGDAEVTIFAPKRREKRAKRLCEAC